MQTTYKFGDQPGQFLTRDASITFYTIPTSRRFVYLTLLVIIDNFMSLSDLDITESDNCGDDSSDATWVWSSSNI